MRSKEPYGSKYGRRPVIKSSKQKRRQLRPLNDDELNKSRSSMLNAVNSEKIKISSKYFADDDTSNFKRTLPPSIFFDGKENKPYHTEDKTPKVSNRAKKSKRNSEYRYLRSERSNCVEKQKEASSISHESNVKEVGKVQEKCQRRKLTLSSSHIPTRNDRYVSTGWTNGSNEKIKKTEQSIKNIHSNIKSSETREINSEVESLMDCSSGDSLSISSEQEYNFQPSQTDEENKFIDHEKRESAIKDRSKLPSVYMNELDSTNQILSRKNFQTNECTAVSKTRYEMPKIIQDQKRHHKKASYQSMIDNPKTKDVFRSKIQHINTNLIRQNYDSTTFFNNMRDGKDHRPVLGATIGGDELLISYSLDGSELTNCTTLTHGKNDEKALRDMISANVVEDITRKVPPRSRHNFLQKSPRIELSKTYSKNKNVTESDSSNKQNERIPKIKFFNDDQSRCNGDNESFDKGRLSLNSSKDALSHPPLPSGWVIKISRSKMRPYYCHPDFGSTWHCPVVLPEEFHYHVHESNESHYVNTSRSRSANLNGNNQYCSDSSYCSQLSTVPEAPSSPRDDDISDSLNVEPSDGKYNSNCLPETHHDSDEMSNFVSESEMSKDLYTLEQHVDPTAQLLGDGVDEMNDTESTASQSFESIDISTCTHNISKLYHTIHSQNNLNTFSSDIMESIEKTETRHEMECDQSINDQDDTKNKNEGVCTIDQYDEKNDDDNITKKVCPVHESYEAYEEHKSPKYYNDYDDAVDNSETLSKENPHGPLSRLSCLDDNEIPLQMGNMAKNGKRRIDEVEQDGSICEHEQIMQKNQNDTNLIHTPDGCKAAEKEHSPHIERGVNMSSDSNVEEQLSPEENQYVENIIFQDDDNDVESRISIDNDQEDKIRKPSRAKSLSVPICSLQLLSPIFDSGNI